MKNALPLFLVSFLILSVSLSVFSQIPNEVNFSQHDHIAGYKKRKRNNPHMFQGNKKKKKYFEGWYFKMVSNGSILSVIPGISISKDGEKQQAFIQLIDGKTTKTSYFSFPIDDFFFSSEKFAIRIGENYFSEDSLVLNIQNDTTSIKGKVIMSDQVYLSEKRKKGIMGWYRFVPFMQCYHGVVSLDHQLVGSIVQDEKVYRFDGGVGYIEKDWGKSMPSSWIWIQSNSFSQKNSSFMLSIANIPWMGNSFTGFLGFHLTDGNVHRFATYTRAKCNLKPVCDDTFQITITDKQYTYHIETYRSQSGMLKAPLQGSMERRIAESIDAQLHLTVYDKENKIIFEDTTSISGLETVGNLDELYPKKQKRKDS